MSKFFKLIIIVLMIAAVMLAVTNFFSVDTMAQRIPVIGTECADPNGTIQPDGCYGDAFNCCR